MNKSINLDLVNLLKKKDELFDVTSTLDYPTIAEVVMWLYEKHGIWITVNPKRERNVSGENYMQFDVDIWRLEGEKGCVLYGIELLQFNSPTEAYEAAIEYCLTKLI